MRKIKAPLGSGAELEVQNVSEKTEQWDFHPQEKVEV